MAAFQKFNSFVEALAEKKHNLGSDSLKVMLTNTEPDGATDALKSDISEISAGNGYTAGGAAVTVTGSAQVDGTYSLIASDVVFTATGEMSAFRYAVLYNDTAANDELIGFWDYGSEVTLDSPFTFTVDFNANNGVLQIT